jgi:hypothetical protein
MMVRFFTLALLVCLPFLCGFASAAALAPTPLAPAAPQAQAHSIRGVISSIDAQRRSFVLDLASGRQVTVHVSQNTRITVGGHPATFARLAVGQRASVSGRYDTARMVLHAHSVTAQN